MEIVNKINEASDYIRIKTNNFSPLVGIVLGSGLGELAEVISDKIVNP